MSKITKLTFALCAAVLITAPASVLAQTVETTDAGVSDELITTAAEEADVPKEVIVDETVSPEDLEIKEPTLLPDSKFYFLKNWSRGLKSLITRDPVKKAELKLKYASEKLLEARKLAEKNKRPEILTKAAENFQKEMERVKEAVDKIKETASTIPEVGKFLDKFVKQQVLQQKILDKLEEKVPEGALEKIRAVKERHLEYFGEVMQKLEDKIQIKSRIENNISNMAGSEFKAVKEMEILKRFEEKAPEEIKEQITEATEGIMEKFGEKIEQMPQKTKERFEDYVEKIKGKAEKKMEILDNVRQRIQQRAGAKDENDENNENDVISNEVSPGAQQQDKKGNN